MGVPCFKGPFRVSLKGKTASKATALKANGSKQDASFRFLGLSVSRSQPGCAVINVMSFIARTCGVRWRTKLRLGKPMRTGTAGTLA